MTGRPPPMPPERRPRLVAAVPAIGPWLPAATLHALFLAVAAGLCVLVLAPPFWLAVGLLLAVGGIVLPDVVPKWGVLLLLGASQLWREPSPTDVAFYLLLAGVHLLHVLGSLAQQIPWRGRVQRAALARPLGRFVRVQAAVQGVAAGALVTFGGARGTVTGLSIVAAAALGLVGRLLARRLRGASWNE